MPLTEPIDPNAQREAFARTLARGALAGPLWLAYDDRGNPYRAVRAPLENGDVIVDNLLASEETLTQEILLHLEERDKRLSRRRVRRA